MGAKKRLGWWYRYKKGGFSHVFWMFGPQYFFNTAFNGGVIRVCFFVRYDPIAYYLFRCCAALVGAALGGFVRFFQVQGRILRQDGTDF